MHNDVYNFKKEIVQKITNIWININKKNDRNQLHVHPDAIFSGVFYVNTPKDNKSTKKNTRQKTHINNSATAAEQQQQGLAQV